LVALRWSRRALADLEHHHAWLARLERGKPDETIQKIRAATRMLERLGDMGRPGVVEGVRELSVRAAPYVVAYRVMDGAIEILAVYQTAQDR
jgi:toxin ParE1/3/4